MSVFSGDIQTPLAVPDPGTDYKLPPPGSLSYGSITAQSALAGTNGVDTLLVAGNRDRQMNGNESTRITENRTHTVQGNQQKKVIGNKVENVIGNFTQTTFQNLSGTVIGATNHLYTGVHTVAHKADQMVQEPVHYMHDVVWQYVKNHNHHDEYTTYQLFAGTSTNVIGWNHDFKGGQTAIIGGAAEKAAFSHTEHLARIHDAALDTRFEAIDSKIGAVQPVVHVTMLHEVAITQKIIVVGVNQYI